MEEYIVYDYNTSGSVGGYDTPTTPDEDDEYGSSADENEPPRDYTGTPPRPRHRSASVSSRRTGYGTPIRYGYPTPPRNIPATPPRNGHSTPLKSVHNSPLRVPGTTTPMRRPMMSPVRRRAPKAHMTGTHGGASVTHKSVPGKPRKSGTGTRSRKNSVHSNIAGDVVKESTGFVKDVMGTVYWLIRKPLMWILSLVLIYILLGTAYMKAKHSMVTALKPLCNLPGMSYVGPGFCEWTSTAWPSDGGPRASREFPKLIDLQTHFEGVLENSAGSSVMALVLKESEIAVRDLTNLVKHSKLVSKDDLTARLEEFVQASKSTSRQLSRFSSRAAGVVDNLLSLDEYAIKTLERAQERIAAPYSFSDIVLYPFRSDIATAEREVLATFIRATSVMDTSIRKLILEAEIALKELDDLEEKLNVIEDIAQRENVDLEEGKRDVLAQFWTKLGGNRDKLAHFDGHQLLLSDISEKRKNALKLVGGSLIHLQTMQSNLEVLRDRVAEPGLLEDAGDEVERIPLEVHIRSIRKGVDRLNEGLQKAKGRENEYMKSMLSAHDAQIRIVESAADGRPTTRVISNN